ncbi:MAG TPA: hypothetical protein VG935_00660 [Patescibacteria group bacterium]|nr:hypothetical protein [Patescibacteria group bacterium]
MVKEIIHFSVGPLAPRNGLFIETMKRSPKVEAGGRLSRQLVQQLGPGRAGLLEDGKVLKRIRRDEQRLQTARHDLLDLIRLHSHDS